MLINHIHKETYWHTVCSIQYIHRIMWAGQHLIKELCPEDNSFLSSKKPYGFWISSATFYTDA